MSRTSPLLFALAFVFAQEAAAFTPIADCTGWYATAPSGSAAHAYGSAVLERLGENGFEQVEISYDEDVLTEPGTMLLEGLWQSTLLTGTYRVLLDVVVEFGTEPRIIDYGTSASAEFECEQPNGGGTARTPGYWKNHEESWPVSSLALGGTSYTDTCLLDFMDVETERDIRVKLIHQLIAAKLNLLPNPIEDVGDVDPATITGVPNASSTIADTIALADLYLALSGTTIDCSTSTLTGAIPSGSTKDFVVLVKDALDVFNNGL